MTLVVYSRPKRTWIVRVEHSSTKVHESFEILNGADSCLHIINHSILNAKCMSHKFVTHTCSCTDSIVLLRKLEIEYIPQVKMFVNTLPLYS